MGTHAIGMFRRTLPDHFHFHFEPLLLNFRALQEIACQRRNPTDCRSTRVPRARDRILAPKGVMNRWAMASWKIRARRSQCRCVRDGRSGNLSRSAGIVLPVASMVMTASYPWSAPKRNRLETLRSFAYSWVRDNAGSACARSGGLVGRTVIDYQHRERRPYRLYNGSRSSGFISRRNHSKNSWHAQDSTPRRIRTKWIQEIRTSPDVCARCSRGYSCGCAGRARPRDDKPARNPYQIPRAEIQSKGAHVAHGQSHHNVREGRDEHRRFHVCEARRIPRQVT